MKSIQNVILILLLVCAPIRCVAVSYASYSGMGEAPTASMRSTSMWASQSRDVQADGTKGGYSGIYTAASAVRGGVTTYDSYNPAEGCGASGPNRAPGVPTVNVFAPIDADGLGVLFLAVLAAGYAIFVWKKSTSEEYRPLH